jgi:sugar/nucleoside kinase (ribokinase family)
MYDFKTFGQMNLDMIFKGFPHIPEAGEEVFAKFFDMQLGGGPMLYSIVLNHLGYKTKLGTFLSDNEPSRICTNLMKKMDFYAYENFNKKEENPVVITGVFSLEQDRSFVAYNRFINEAMLSEEEVYEFLKDARVISAPIGHLGALKRLHNEGRKVVFDVGWSDFLNVENLKNTLQYVDIFAPNDKEAMKMTGKESPEAALLVLKNYTKTPIVTTGQQGCIYYDHGVKYIPAVSHIKSVDTTGAGDNFVTGIIYGLLQEYSLCDCIKLGTVFAGYSTTKMGCYGTMITKEIIDSYYVKA